jgi:CO dehydrogenase/acetyl-CoA synthase beta subunit
MESKTSERLTNLRNRAVGELVDLFWNDIPDKVLDKHINEEKATEIADKLEKLLHELMQNVYELNVETETETTEIM